MDARITVIIPTTAVSERRDYLRRAIDSVLKQSDVEVRALVIANGKRCDDAVLRELAGTKRIEVKRLAEENLPNALKFGRECVDTPYFSELDDDDLLLPQGLYDLSCAFLRDPEAHVIIGNALIRREGFDDIRIFDDIELLRTNPLGALLDKNWMVPGAALFRSEMVSAADFANIPKYLEWTYVAAMLCLKHKVSFIPRPVVAHYLGYPFSTDASREALFGRIDALRTILGLPLPADIERGFRRKLSAAYHQCSVAYLDERKYLSALTCHINSLNCAGGWRYLSYTRRVFTGPLTNQGTPD